MINQINRFLGFNTNTGDAVDEQKLQKQVAKSVMPVKPGDLQKRVC